MCVCPLFPFSIVGVGATLVPAFGQSQRGAHARPAGAGLADSTVGRPRPRGQCEEKRAHEV